MKLDKWLRVQTRECENLINDLREDGEAAEYEQGYANAIENVWNIRQMDKREMEGFLDDLEEKVKASTPRKDITAVEPMEFWKGVEYCLNAVRERIGK